MRISVWDGMSAEELFIKVRNKVNIADCGRNGGILALHKCIKTTKY